MRTVYAMLDAFVRAADYWGVFLGALVAALLLVPLCRRLSMALGMVDMPGPRRINKTPIPRAGGLAVYLAVALTLGACAAIEGGKVGALSGGLLAKLLALATVLVAVGFADDKFSLPPKVKLLGQVLVALGAHFWAGVGFAHTFPAMPGWLDCLATTFWIVGAINAFNLIDGLDGLASGLSLIACTGIAGSLFFVGRPTETLVYFALAGACLGFLRYNFNPASVFLGDTGSMYLGFVISTLPLVTNSSDSLFVSVGVPLLAMGVPIFDTSLAILRRSLRAVLRREEHADVGNGKVMQADADHLHHRILRSVASQRTAAFILYAMSGVLVLTGMFGLMLRSRAVGLYIVIFMVAVTVVFRDMRRIELWDAGRLLSLAAHDRTLKGFRLRRALVVPVQVILDLVALFAAWAVARGLLEANFSWLVFRRGVPIYVGCTFVALVAMGVYRVAWGRAQAVNYLRLVIACVCGALVAASASIFLGFNTSSVAADTALFATVSTLLTLFVRVSRVLVRDLFYELGRLRLTDTSTRRVLAYGAGLRFRAFRREMVRRTGRSDRLLVGLLDDDPLMRGRVIGSLQVYGALHSAGEAIKELKVDEVVITCNLPPERVAEVAAYLKPLGVKVSLWKCAEEAL